MIIRTLLTALLAGLMLIALGCSARTVDDSAITTKVKSKLAADADTSAIRITVETNNGVVTLTGTVPTTTEKAKAGQLAENTDGVRRVINNITVNPDTASMPSASR